jgi:hypothetical protein
LSRAIDFNNAYLALLALVEISFKFIEFKMIRELSGCCSIQDSAVFSTETIVLSDLEQLEQKNISEIIVISFLNISNKLFSLN